MSNEVFPTLKGLSWACSKTPVFATKIQEAVSGREVRLAQRANPMWRFKLSYEFLEGMRVAGVSELEKLLGLFMRHRGSFDSFLYTDPNDDDVVDQSIGIGNGVNKSFQLLRTWGGFTEPVTNVNAIVNVKVGGVITTAYTISKGLITFTTAPAAGKSITWTGSYYYRARFSDDYLDADTLAQDLWEAKKVDLYATLGARL